MMSTSTSLRHVVLAVPAQVLRALARRALPPPCSTVFVPVVTVRQLPFRSLTCSFTVTLALASPEFSSTHQPWAEAGSLVRLSDEAGSGPSARAGGDQQSSPAVRVVVKVEATGDGMRRDHSGWQADLVDLSPFPIRLEGYRPHGDRTSWRVSARPFAG